MLAWRDDLEVFTWLFSQEILDEYREVLRRLKVPRHAAGRFINLLSQGGEEITGQMAGEFSPDPKDDPFYHCALAYEYPISLAQIHAALSYYYDHQDELDAEIAGQMQEYEELRAQAENSPLRQKLRALGKLR